MDFAAGLILGAICGVIADRLFTYLVEKRVYVTIQPSFPMYIDKGNGLSIHVTNEGMEALPPYRIGFYNPHRGTVYFFEHEQKTDRLPGQTDVFTVWQAFLIREKEFLLSWLTKSELPGQNPSEIHLTEMTPEQSQKWFLRLVVEGSENRILYENNRVGVALIEILRNSLQRGQIEANGEQASRAHVTTNPWVRWRNWWRTRRELRRLEAGP